MRWKALAKKCTIVSLIIVAVLFVIEYSTINKPVTVDNYSFYYRDSLDVKELIDNNPGFDNVASLSPSLRLDGDYIFYDGSVSDSTFAFNMNQYVELENRTSKNRKIIDVRIKSWKDDVYYLDEIDASYHGAVSRLFFYLKGASERHIYSRNNYESLLLTQNDTTYYTKGGFLCLMTKDLEKKICKFPIEDPIHNQMIKIGDTAFIRTGYSIYYSNDNLITWKRIYNGYRSIKESLYYDHEKERLLFSQYTPGKIRIRHYLRSYSIKEDRIDSLVTFYTQQEYKESGLVPFCRHMHILTEDPFTGNLFLGNGDGDAEAGIYYSDDKGNSFKRVGGGDQTWRTLSFIFTKKYIFWNNDCATPQFLCRINREDLDSLPMTNNRVTRFPLVNGACWGVNKYDNMYIMSSNSEGSLYDHNHRVYGIVIDEEGIPIVYNLLAEKSTRLSSNQLFIQGIDCRGVIWFHDESGTRKFKLKKIK